MILDEELEESKGPVLSDKDIFTQIWTSPRVVYRFLNEYDYNKHTVWLLAVGGAIEALDRNNLTPGSWNIWVTLLVAMFFGALLGWIGYWIGAALLRWTGRWIGGQANTAQILRVIAYSILPNIPAVILLIPLVLIFGTGVFQGYVDIYQNGYISAAIYWSMIGIQMILGIWSLVLTAVGLSVVQRFSVGKAIANMLLAFLVIFIPIMVFVFTFIDSVGSMF